MNGEVFAAANEDNYTGFANMWFNPTTKDRYGSICFGLSDLQAQAAMNEYGLFYDFTAQNIKPESYQLTKPYQGDLMFEILGKCKTVVEALEYMKTHEYSVGSQVLIADATGNSVIVNPGAKVLKNGSYQINTNFDIRDLAGHNYTCGRYDIADRMLSNTSSVSVPFLKDVLNRTRQEGNLSTIYSNIYDLKRGIIYIYNFHDFNHVLTIDLKKELKKGYRLQRVEDQFPVSFANQNFLEKDTLGYRKQQILREVERSGLTDVVTRYTDAKNSTKDKHTNPALLEVAIQLLKETYNKHGNGGMWEYWFGLPGGYNVQTISDERVNAARKLFEYLVKQSDFDVKYGNFINELIAYTYALDGNKQLSAEFYKKASTIEANTWPITYKRSKEMLSRL